MTASPTDDLASAERRIQELTKELAQSRGELAEAQKQQAATAGVNTRLFEEAQTRNTELRAALEQQTATSDILHVIDSSPTDIQPVFDTIVENAKRLLNAYSAGVMTLAGEEIHLRAFTTTGEAGDDTLQELRLRPRALASAPLLASMFRDLVPRIVSDTETDRRIPPVVRETARIRGYRSFLTVPMVRRGQAIGSINVTRRDAGMFADEEIALIKTFADQAVIAIENTRLFEAEQASKRELKESLEYQTAISDVLNVISRSPTDVQPVFDMIAKCAMELCHAEFCNVFRFDGQLVYFAASHGTRPEVRTLMLARGALPPGRGNAAGRAILSNAIEELPDVSADPDYALRDIAKAGAYGSIMAVPMKKDGSPIGALTVGRSQVGPFPAGQIELLKTFAEQAVIAIENTRLFEAEQASKRELTEALEQQTATADVLKVISRSAFDLQAVLDTLVESAARLCHADKANIARISAGAFQFISFFGFNPEYREYLLSLQTSMADRGSITGRTVVEGRTVHVVDLMADPEFTWFEAQKRGGFRTALGVPLMREGTPIGVFFLAREEVEPFTQQEIDLVTTFADQAVIAIENTRLFEEVQARTHDLQESLDYQTATSDVLGVISRSPNQLQPVLDAIVETAFGLCPSDGAAIMLREADRYRRVASAGYTPEENRDRKELPVPIDRGSVVGRVALEGRTIHVHDVKSDPDYNCTLWPSGFRRARRTVLGVPLVREGNIAGVIILFRTEVEPYSQRQIELIETFADQAVIAMNNARLFEEVQARTKELQDSLDRQTATSEVLGVISRSPNEVQPVLDTIVATAQRLCKAERAMIWRLQGDTFRTVTHLGLPTDRIDAALKQRLPVGRGSVVGRAAAARRAIQVEDVVADPELAAQHDYNRASNTHTVLAVPLLLKGHPIGVITLGRTRVAPFDDEQVALVESFADQAVIAIENSRLFEAEQASKRELQESLEHQTATSEVLGVISRSPTDVQPVFDMIAQSAAQVCNARHCNVFRFDGQFIHFAASHGLSAEAQEMMRRRSPIPMGRGSAAGRAIADNAVAEIQDIPTDQAYHQGDIAKVGDYRSAIAVPIRKDGQPIGAIALTRRETGPFPQGQIDLLRTFADQAVIAIENTRLFEEVQARTRELAKTVEDLEIASQHKNQFVANMSHELRTPLAAILGYAELIQEGFYEPQGPKSLDALTRICSNGKHLLGLINTVLDIAKIESGQFTLNMSEYAIESVVETVRAATESLAQNKRITLTTSVDKSLPVGLGDEQRLTQVLLNLVGNAIKFTDAGEVSIAAGSRNGHFAVSVTDTGPGIPLDQQGRIFDQFHQVDSSLTKAKGGTGLGLAIAKQIVEMHGGRIWVESTPGKGSTFQMELPTRAEFRKLASGGAA
jgi:GAF domain-containing protein